MCQVLRNFIKSLKTSNANFALSFKGSTVIQLGRNMGSYEKSVSS